MVVRKMKEKCKDAARMRREKERAEFVELSKLLPLPSSITSQLDKASIIRLTSSYLRMRSAFPQGLGMNWGKNNHAASLHSSKTTTTATNQHHSSSEPQQVRELGSLLLQTLDGFVFALHKDGKIMYISETASVHLGLPQIDLTGSSVFEFIHPSDHNDIYEALGLHENDKANLNSSWTSQVQGNQREIPRSFCMRMKCILPKRNAGLVTSGYKAIHCNGYLKVRYQNKHSTLGRESSSVDKEDGDWESCALVAVGHSLLPSASTEVKLTSNSFMFRANLDLKLYYIEAPVVRLLGFQQVEMIGQSLYQFVHAADLNSLELSHRSLLEKGQVVTRYYRLIKRGGGFIWIQSYASLVNNPRNMPKPQHIVSINLVLSNDIQDHSGILHIQQSNSNNTSVEDALEYTMNESVTNLATSTGTQQTTTKTKDFLPISTCPPVEQQQHKSSSLVRARERHSTPSRKGRKLKIFDGNASVIPQVSRLNTDSNNQLITQNIYHCNCKNSESCSSVLIDHQGQTTIGSIRRFSEDSCSVVSSVASTIATSSVSSISLHQNNDYTSYTSGLESYICNERVTSSQTAPFVTSFSSSTLKSYGDLIQDEATHHEGSTYVNSYNQYQLPAINEGSNLVRNGCQFWTDINNNNLSPEGATTVNSSMINSQLNQLTNSCNQACLETNVYFQASPDWTAQSSYPSHIGVTMEAQKSQSDERQSTNGRNHVFPNYYNDNQAYLSNSNSNHYHPLPVKSGFEMSSI